MEFHRNTNDKSCKKAESVRLGNFDAKIRPETLSRSPRAFRKPSSTPPYPLSALSPLNIGPPPSHCPSVPRPMMDSVFWRRDGAAVKSFVERSKPVSVADAALQKLNMVKAKAAAKLKAFDDDGDDNAVEETTPVPEEVSNLTKRIAAATEQLTDERAAANVYASIKEAIEGMDLYRCLSPHDVSQKTQNKALVAGDLLRRANLNCILNAILCVEGGAIDAMDDSVIKSGIRDTKTVTKAGAEIPRRAQETARILRRCLQAQVELDEMNTTPERIVEMLCPELDMTAVNSLCQRIYDRTGSSARMLDYEDMDEPPVDKKKGSALTGDPNNIAGLQKCKHCEELACQTFDRAMSDEERFSVFREKHAYWVRIRPRVRDWSLSRWQMWAATRPPWFSPAAISYVPDDMIPAEVSGSELSRTSHVIVS